MMLLRPFVIALLLAPAMPLPLAAPAAAQAATPEPEWAGDWRAVAEGDVLVVRKGAEEMGRLRRVRGAMVFMPPGVKYAPIMATIGVVGDQWEVVGRGGTKFGRAPIGAVGPVVWFLESNYPAIREEFVVAQRAAAATSAPAATPAPAAEEPPRPPVTRLPATLDAYEIAPAGPGWSLKLDGQPVGWLEKYSQGYLAKNTDDRTIGKLRLGIEGNWDLLTPRNEQVAYFDGKALYDDSGKLLVRIRGEHAVARAAAAVFYGAKNVRRVLP